MSKELFRAELAKCSTPEAAAERGGELIEAMQVQLQEANETIKTQGERLELVEKGAKDVQAAIAAKDEVIAELKNSMRQTPEAGEAKDKINLSDVRDWHKPVGKGDDQRDLVAQVLGTMPIDQFNLTCRSPKQLGIDPESATGKAIRRYQALSDFEAMLIPYVARKHPELLSDMQKHPLVKERVALGEKLREAAKVALADDAMAGGNASYGGNWVRPEVLSSRVFDYIENERVLLRYFEELPMSTKVMSLPVLGSLAYPVGLKENVDLDGGETYASITPGNFTTLKATFTAKGYAHSVVCTPWWFEDGIVGADYVSRFLARAMARGEERWMMNGQGVDFDTSATIDTTGTPATNDIRLLSFGLRKFNSQVQAAFPGMAVDLSAGLTGEAVAKIFGRQGPWAHRINQSIFVVSPIGMTACLLLKTQEGYNLVQTYSEMGRPGTVQTGSLAQMYGRPIVVSDEVSETMDANGIEAGGNATAIYHVNTDAVKVGRRTGMRVEFSDQVRFEKHQDVFKVTARADIQAIYSASTNKFINAGVGLPSTL